MAKGSWTTVEPKDAVGLKLPHPEIQGPVNEMGEECPWPWEPQQLVGAPLGQYHCGYCGGMNVAGVPHLDWSDDPEVMAWKKARETPRPDWLDTSVPDEVWWAHLVHPPSEEKTIGQFDPRKHCYTCKKNFEACKEAAS